jgi:hypothetical protein
MAREMILLNHGFMEGTELYFGVVNGIDNGWISSGTNNGWDTANVVNYYAGITMPLPVTGLRFGFSYDYRGQSERTDDAGAVTSRSAWANAYAAYLAYDVTDKLTLANRAEYANVTTVLGTFTGEDAEISLILHRLLQAVKT